MIHLVSDPVLNNMLTLDYQINGYKEITVLSMEFFQNLNSPQLNNRPTSDIRKLF